MSHLIFQNVYFPHLVLIHKTALTTLVDHLFNFLVYKVFFYQFFCLVLQIIVSKDLLSLYSLLLNGVDKNQEPL